MTLSDSTHVPPAATPVLQVPTVDASSFLELRRQWRPGEKLKLRLDMSLRYWAEQKECEGISAVYRGPILLAYDQLLKAVEPDDVPANDATSLDFQPVDYRLHPAIRDQERTFVNYPY